MREAAQQHQWSQGGRGGLQQPKCGFGDDPLTHQASSLLNSTPASGAISTELSTVVWPEVVCREESGPNSHQSDGEAALTGGRTSIWGAGAWQQRPRHTR